MSSQNYKTVVASFDYSQCEFEVHLQKKKRWGYIKRYVYIKKHQIIICKKAYAVIPRKIISLDPFWHVDWLVSKKKQHLGFEERTVGFRIINEEGQKVLELYGDPSAFKEMRKYFAKYIFETGMFEDYDIIKKIGSGKYAKVYQIQDKVTKQQYAAKYLEKSKLESIEFGKESLLNELNILRMLDHQNCIKIIRTYEEEKGYFIVTQLLNPTKTLQDELQKFKNPTFGYPLVKNIMKQLLEGICYVHSLGIMHRDLKPQNIMFSDQNPATMTNLKIIDFGLAQFTSSKKYMYVHVGTPGYVAPEILANESESHTYTELCDIFSLGVIFHILLTGKTVFQGSKFNEVLKLNKTAHISLHGKRYEEMDADALNLLKQMLHQNPRIRITAAEALQHPYFIDNKSECMPRLKSVSNLNNLLESTTSPQMRPTKKHSLQFFGRYKNTNIDLTEEQQRKILQQLKSPDQLKQDPVQKQMLYKITKQLVEICYNKQQSTYSDLDNPFSSTSSPLRFAMQKSRLNSVESLQLVNSPHKDYHDQITFQTQIAETHSNHQIQQQSNTPGRKSVDISPHKKYSISNNKPLEIFKEEEELLNDYRDSYMSSQGMQINKKNQNKYKQNSNSNIKEEEGNISSQDGKNQNSENPEFCLIKQQNSDNDILRSPPPLSEEIKENGKFSFPNVKDSPKSASQKYFNEKGPGSVTKQYHTPLSSSKIEQKILPKQQEEINNKSVPNIPNDSMHRQLSYQQQTSSLSNVHISSNANAKLISQTREHVMSSPSQIQSLNSISILSKQQQQQAKQHKQTSISQFNNEDIDKVQYPKELNWLLDYFPEKIIKCFMQKNPDQKQGIRLLGLFLLFGTDRYIKNDNKTQIFRRFELLNKNQVFDNWFIELLKEMVEDRIDLLNILIRLNKYVDV